MKKLSKLLPIIKFIFPALNKRGICVSEVGAVPLPAGCYLLSPSFCFSCELSPAATSGLHLFIWASQILGFYYPACGLCMVQAGCLCPAGHRRELTAQSTGDLLARYFKGLITLCASEFWLGAPVLCVRCVTGRPAAEWTSGLGSSGRCCPESGLASLCPPP